MGWVRGKEPPSDRFSGRSKKRALTGRDPHFLVPSLGSERPEMVTFSLSGKSAQERRRVFDIKFTMFSEKNKDWVAETLRCFYRFIWSKTDTKAVRGEYKTL